MQEIGIDGKLLMENAGRAICGKMKAIIRKENRIIVFAGSGNNGGDGFVIARTLLNEMYDVQVVQVVPNAKIKGDALYHKQLFLKCGGTVIIVEQEPDVNDLVVGSDVIIDAMIGIGIKGQLREPLRRIVDLLNKTAAYTISIDIPSGLPADEGMHDFTAVQADYTFMVGLLKMSAFLNIRHPFMENGRRFPLVFLK
nr:NAD(P)H-hydrate epimerase [Virgibacillus natechei]